MEAVIKLYGPVVAFIIFLILLCRKKLNITSKSTSVVFLSFLKLDLPVSNPIIMRLLLVILMIASPMMYLFIDYSKLFPNHFSMQVFYDSEGILNTLNQFPEKKLNEYKVSKNLAVRDTVYFKHLDDQIRKFKVTDTFFCKQKSIIYSSGETSFNVERSSGIQTYYITESRGEVTHKLECPDIKEVQPITSYFEKIPTSNDFIKPSMGTIVLKPEFKQIIAENKTSKGVIFNHILHGLSAVEIFPFPSYERTVYLFQYNDSLYPIGYAVYK